MIHIGKLRETKNEKMRDNSQEGNSKMKSQNSKNNLYQ